MSYAPQSLREVASLWVAHGGKNLGIVGDDDHKARPSYHNGRDVITAYGRTCATDYTICHRRDVRGLSDAASAIDLGPIDGSYRQLRRFTKWLGDRLLAQAPDTADIREILGSPDGVTVLCWFSGQLFSDGKPRTQTGCANDSHLTHTHISYFRDSEFKDKTGPFVAYFAGEAPAPKEDAMPSSFTAGGLKLASSYVVELKAGTPLYDAPGQVRTKLSKDAAVDYFGLAGSWRLVLVTTAAGYKDGVSRPTLVLVDSGAGTVRAKTAAEMNATATRLGFDIDCSDEIAQARTKALADAKAAVDAALSRL